MAHVEIKGLRKNYGAFEVIRGINLSIEKGEFCALLGPSGCGKSTLLRLIAGLDDVSSGEIHIAQRDVTDLESSKRAISMVFQSYALYPHMTVAENIAFSLEVQKVAKADRRARAVEVAKLLHLEELLDRKPSALSGGQRQRVAIGRALVRNPEVFLFDEPLSNLDALLRVQMRIELANLHREIGATMIYVTHDQIEAMTMADRIVVLEGGAIQQVGTPLELYEQPANRFVASFIGSPAMSFLQAAVADTDAEHHHVELSGSRLQIAGRNGITLNAGSNCEIGIRPEHCEIVAAGEGNIDGKVHLVERLGSQTFVHVQTAMGAVTVQAAAHIPIALGDQASVSIDASKAHLFNEQGEIV